MKKIIILGITLTLAASLSADRISTDLISANTNITKRTGDYVITTTLTKTIEEVYKDGKLSKRIATRVMTKPNGEVIDGREVFHYNDKGELILRDNGKMPLINLALARIKEARGK